jgi:hypothetical protein
MVKVTECLEKVNERLVKVTECLVKVTERME